jgi:hypothetical protein
MTVNGESGQVACHFAKQLSLVSVKDQPDVTGESRSKGNKQVSAEDGYGPAGDIDQATE